MKNKYAVIDTESILRYLFESGKLPAPEVHYAKVQPVGETPKPTAS